MSDAQASTALPIWLVSNQFAINPVTMYSPGLQGPIPIPYLSGQPSISGFPQNIPNPLTQSPATRKRKRRKQTVSVSDSNINNKDANAPTVLIPEEATIKTATPGDGGNKTQEASVMASSGTTLPRSMPINGLPAVMVRNTCRVCSKPFRSGQLLRQHMLVHSDHRKYQCRYCDRSFKQLSHLQQHHRIHTGEKPYKCELPGCNRSFPQLSNLQHHYRNHDKPEPPSDRICAFCDRAYCSEVVLRNHVMKIHMANKNDPKLNQLQIKELENLHSHPNTLSDSVNLTSNVVDLTMDIDEMITDKSIVNFNKNNTEVEVEGNVDRSSGSPPQKIQRGSVSDRQVHKRVTLGESRTAGPVVEMPSSLGLIPLNQLNKVGKMFESIVNTPLPNINALFSTDAKPTQEDLSRDDVKELAENNDSLKEHKVNESGIVDTACHRKCDANERSMVSQESTFMQDFVSHKIRSLYESAIEEMDKKNTASLEQTFVSNKASSMYDNMMEEMNRKQMGFMDAGHGYNYVIDNDYETKEKDESATEMTDYSGINKGKSDIKTTSCNGELLKQETLLGCSVGLMSKKNENNTMCMNGEGEIASKQCAVRLIADAETSVYTKVSCSDNKVRVNFDENRTTIKPKGMSLTMESKMNETDNWSSQNGIEAEIVQRDLGRARKRKSFVPQRICVPD